MKRKKNIRVDVDILESAGDGDRYLVRYFVPGLGLQAVEWVSLAGVTRWLNTTANTTVMNEIMAAIKAKIEQTKQGVEDGSKIDSTPNEMD